MAIEVHVELDDKLVAELMRWTGITDVQELVRRALKELIHNRRRSTQSQSTD